MQVGWKKLFALALCSLLSPLAGVRYSPVPLEALLQFPPLAVRTGMHPVTHAPFAWSIWSVYALLAFLCALFFANEFRSGFSGAAYLLRPKREAKNSAQLVLLLGIFLLSAGWGVSWGLLPGTAPLLPLAFPVLWLGYCMTAEGLLIAARSGPSWQCCRHYWLLFPVSALFWWCFEYLNRFVQNWSYLGAAELSPVEYGVYASLAFATVLPATLASSRLIGLSQRTNHSRGWRVRLSLAAHARSAGILLIVGGMAALALTTIFPTQLFALLWLAPLVIAAGLLLAERDELLLNSLKRGNWNFAVRWSLAALICGFFWEGWNFWSTLKWVYHIPYVETAYVFEMPLVGFAGYLPFGILCGLVCSWVSPYILLTR